MRLLLKLSTYPDTLLTLNYHYALSSAIYNLLHFGSPEFASFLHDIGYRLNGKKYKLFCFAIRFANINVINDSIKLLTPEAELYITSPLIEDFVKNFVIGSFEKQTIKITDRNLTAEFQIHQMESLPEINLSSGAKFISLSPLVLSTIKEYKGELKQYYLRPEDKEDINRVITHNLKNKYMLIYGKEISGGELKLNWDKDYLKRHNRVTKKVTINKNGRYPVDVIGIQAPFTLEGNQELIMVGYECGFGEKNSMGFGMAEVIDLHSAKN